MLHLNVLVLAPLLLTFIFHIPNLVYLFYKKWHHKLNIPKPLRNIIMIYFIGFTIILFIAFFDGFYFEFHSVNDKQSGYLYSMYFITISLIYIIQYLSSKYFNSFFLSNKIFRIIIYFLESVFSPTVLHLYLN